MTKQQKLLVAMNQVDNLMSLSSDFDYESYLNLRLTQVKYELQRQYKLLDIKALSP